MAQYQADRGALDRLRPFPLSAARLDRLERLHRDWLARLDAVPFEELPRRDQIDWLLLRNQVEHELARVAIERAREAEIAPLAPFAPPLVALLEARVRREPVEAAAAASTLAAAVEAVATATETLRAEPPAVSGAVANRAAGAIERLRRRLAGWYRYGAGYDPLFTWWCSAPWQELDRALGDYATFLRREVGRLDPNDPDQLVGDPIGRDALLAELAFERIAQTPEELIAIAERELAWCQEQRRAAAAELGFGDDWRAAQEQVKEDYAEPGGQPRTIAGLAAEAVRFLKERDLITIPPLAEEVWRMEMMSPERQKMTPYFTGGEVISISYPTTEMAHTDKLMSMRGNNLHWSRATVHHELIPGHHLQGFMSQRWNPQRRPFGTPFYLEGWALYWELRLWDLGFAQGPEDRLGMLFWRAHRCARIIFSLRFQLGEWSPQQCVDFLVEQVGHERRNATAEVRRSIQGGYGPLYQCAYLVGGLQLRALHDELVGGAGWSERDFHDAVLKENSMPIEFLRAALTDQPLGRDFPVSWRWHEGRAAR
ncbi:MAG: DUF885 domain-containing protein [Planctomycetota bacterium]|nr:MAG: DUF885 domain-containing protein [Planctomycetota bacterium]